jgi:hypothetical protein
VILLLILAGCDTPTKAAIRRCEMRIQEELVAPSTYRRINLETVGEGDNAIITIDFDAQNRMGVPLRHHASCIGNAPPLVTGPNHEPI